MEQEDERGRVVLMYASQDEQIVRAFVAFLNDGLLSEVIDHST